MNESDLPCCCSDDTPLNMSSSGERTRKMNYTTEELDILVDNAIVHNRTLQASFTADITQKTKNGIWQDIAEKMNAVSSIRRKWGDIRNKWSEMKCAVKKRAISLDQSQKRTGGGPPPKPLSEREERIRAVIPNCQVQGIPGAMETGGFEEFLDNTPSTATTFPATVTFAVDEECSETAITSQQSQFMEAAIPENSASTSFAPSNSVTSKGKEEISFRQELLHMKRVKVEQEKEFQQKMLKLEEDKSNTLIDIKKILGNIEIALSNSVSNTSNSPSPSSNVSLSVSPIIKGVKPWYLQ